MKLGTYCGGVYVALTNEAERCCLAVLELHFQKLIVTVHKNAYQYPRLSVSKRKLIYFLSSPQNT